MRVHRFDASLGFRHSAIVALLAVLLVFSGCGGEESGSSSEWTVEEGALTLKEDLMVSETEAFYFGSVSDVAVGGEGRIYVLDAQASHVKMLRPDGTLIDSLGGSGQGPGEFEGAAQLAVARADSLYVFERGSREISVFTPAGQFVRAVPFTTGGAAPRAFMVPDDAPGFLLTLVSPPGSSDQKETYLVQRIRPDGTPGDTLLTDRSREMVSDERGIIFVPVPFGIKPEVALGPDGKLHFGRSDSLKVDTYSLSGVQEGSVALPFDPVPVTEEEREDHLQHPNSTVNARLADAMPESKPAFRDFFLDDEGQYWFRRPTAHTDSTDWWVADPDEQTVATTRLPDDIYIMTARDGFAYGRTDTEAGAPAVVRYDVSIER